MTDSSKIVLEQKITDFIQNRLIRDPSVRLTPATPLVSSGLVDSFDLVDILSEVERISGKKLPAGRIGPQDMESIEQIVRLLERFDS